MREQFLDGVQATIKAIVSVGTAIGVFSLELLLLEKGIPYYGAAKLTTAICNAGKLVKSPSMAGGLTVMVGSSSLVGYEAGEAFDHLFNCLRAKE